MADTMERAKSEGASPTGSPQKWKEESEGELMGGGQEGGVRGGGGRGAGVVRERRRGSEAMLSSDEEEDVGKSESTGRPRQRSLRRKKIGFTDNLTSEQLVRKIYVTVLSRHTKQAYHYYGHCINRVLIKHTVLCRHAPTVLSRCTP